MRTVRINASTPYDVIIGEGLHARCGELCREVIAPCKACIVSDDNVAPLYLEGVSTSLKESGFETVSFVFAHGETSKTAHTLIALVEYLAQNGFTRADCIVALGGGVVGDLAGFAAATYMRGIRFVQLPTTLLAAVDSSVGGKTGVDLSAGKNLFGAFHQPSLVICDYSALDTLPDEIFADGCAEVIKYGIIDDRAFFDTLRYSVREQIEDVITTCVKNKARIVEADEREGGRRKLLNLGHTIGHAIESCSGFTISHGSAVAIGTVIVTRAAVSMGICGEDDLSLITELFEKVGLPTSCTFSAEELARAAVSDKKRMGDTITLVIPHAIGNSVLTDIPVCELYELIKRGL